MKRKTLATAFLILIVVVIWWILRASPKSTPHQTSAAFGPSPLASETPSASAATPLATSEPQVGRKAAITRVLGALTAPIAFYGKVVDQNGEPVADANVKYGTIDKFDAEGSHYSSKSDRNGEFSISGIRGAVLTVGVWKNGYYVVDDKSTGSFAYGTGPDSTRKPPPTRERPAIFLLQKMGATEPLVQLTSRQIDVPRSGEPLLVDLATGRKGQGNLQVEAWIGDTSKRRFDWRYRLSVPGGGLVERTGPFDFEAPAKGYEPDIGIKMSADAEHWSSDVNKSYFAKLPDGKYARLSINLYPGERNFVVLESYLNPQPGSRNLEFDPAKQIKTK